MIRTHRHSAIGKQGGIIKRVTSGVETAISSTVPHQSTLPNLAADPRGARHWL
jgi:hypothetical protein